MSESVTENGRKSLPMASTPSVSFDPCVTSTLRSRYEELIADGNSHPEKLEETLCKIRKLILLNGLPPETIREQKMYDTHGTLRGNIWKLLLGVKRLDATYYVSLVERNACIQYQKIRGDTFRTFPTNENYSKRVPEQKLIRVLNAFIHSCEGNSDRIAYVQGMNVVCAPFLYVMPELDGFFTFSRFIKHCAPLYFSPTIEGAYRGLLLLDDLLQLVDPELYAFLQEKSLLPDCFAMPRILSFSAATPPLEEVLKLWDFLFAFGVHMNVICVAAQLVSKREEILRALKPNTLLRKLEPLEASVVISIACQLVRQIPEDLYMKLVEHPFVSREKKDKKKFNTLPMNFKRLGKQLE